MDMKRKTLTSTHTKYACIRDNLQEAPFILLFSVLPSASVVERDRTKIILSISGSHLHLLAGYNISDFWKVL